MLGKQAKILRDIEIKGVLKELDERRLPLRDKVMFLLSLHGLRAKEIADLEISMVTDASGSVSDVIEVLDKAAKGKSGRRIPMTPLLHDTLKAYMAEPQPFRTKFVICGTKAEKLSPNAVAVWFRRLYKSVGLEGASSHSGRRTFITNCARNVSKAGGSIRDVMALAGHRHLATTQRYVEQDAEAQRNLIGMIYNAI
jgi:integrase/recombinase XerD